jgi:hypothetical protein
MPTGRRTSTSADYRNIGINQPQNKKLKSVSIGPQLPIGLHVLQRRLTPSANGHLSRLLRPCHGMAATPAMCHQLCTPCGGMTTLPQTVTGSVHAARAKRFGDHCCTIISRSCNPQSLSG